MLTKRGPMIGMTAGACLAVVLFANEATTTTSFSLADKPTCAALEERASTIGAERSVQLHLRDGAEFSLSMQSLITKGALLFCANWTEQEGGGRPLSKGTGRPLADPGHR